MAQNAPEQRLLSLAAYLLKQEEPVSWPRLREEFAEFYSGSDEAVERKWTRDKQTLHELGIPIDYVPGELGSEGGYVIRPEAFQLQDLHLTPDEAAVLWTAAQAAGRMHLHPWRRQVLNACDKLRAACRALPPAAATLPIRHGERADRGETTQLVERIGEALERRKRVTLEYFTASRGEVTTREVDIYGFAWRRGIWLFAGHCHLRKTLRVFYVDNVRTLTVNARKPADRDYEIPSDFDIAAYSKQQPWEYWVHAPLTAQVRMKGAVARIAGELIPGGRVEDAPEGGVLVTVTEVRNLHALVRAVLSFGTDAELVSPEEGRALAREMLGTLGRKLEVRMGRSA